MTVPVSPNPKTLANEGKSDAVMSDWEREVAALPELERRVLRAMRRVAVRDGLLIDCERASEVVALVRGAIADEIEADMNEYHPFSPPTYTGGMRHAAKVVRDSVSPPLAGDRQ